MTVTKSKPLQQFSDRAEFESSAVHEAFYDEDSTRLFVVLTSGKVCGYEGVGRNVWEDFLNTTSAGRFWNKEIKRNRNLRKLNGDVDFFERPRNEINLNESFNKQYFDTITTNKVESTVIQQPKTVFLVTVAVEADSLTDAIDRVGGNVVGVQTVL